MKSLLLKNLDRACLAILAAGALCGAVWIATTIATQQRSLQQEKDQSIQELKELKQADMNIKTLQQALGQARQEMASLNRRIPEKDDIGNFIKQLNILLRERRITMATFQPQTAIPEELHRKIPIRLVFEGTFVQIYYFLRELETMDRLLVPEKMTITSAEPPRECQVDLTVFVFARKAEG